MASRSSVAMATLTNWARNCALALLLAEVCALGCGTQGDASALYDRWPRSGLYGYKLLNPEAPLWISSSTWNLDEPAVLPTNSSDELTVFGRMMPAQGSGPSKLFRAKSLSQNQTATPELALEATLPWEGQALRSPSFAATSPPLLFYQGGDGSVGVARLAEAGLQKGTTTAPLASAALLGGGRPIGRVSAALDLAQNASSGRLRLFYTVDDFAVYSADADADAVEKAAFDGGPPVAWQVYPLKLQAPNFRVPPGDMRAVLAQHISDLSVHRVTTASGRVRWDLFLVAKSNRNAAFCAASAYGQSDLRSPLSFLVVDERVLEIEDGTPLSPAATVFANQPLLLFGLQRDSTGIALGGLD